MPDVIRTNALTRSYGSRRGIDRVSLAIPRGALYGFLGPNGAGKTTTIRVLLGFLRATAGSATIDDLDCWRDSARIKAQVGAIPGDLRLWPWLTGHAALRLFGRIRGQDLRRHGAELAEELELDLAVRVRTMSRGMRQKLGLILALAHKPRVLILDEPTTALDPLMQERLRVILRRGAAAGQTVFFSSHTLGEVEALCERVAIVRAGRIVADGPLADLRRRAGHDVTITWRPGMSALAPLDPPPGLALDQRRPSLWRGSVAGDITPILAWLGALPPGTLDDVTITRPDLETLFRRYYEDEPATRPASDKPGSDNPAHQAADQPADSPAKTPATGTTSPAFTPTSLPSGARP